jgi:hypothetical protein
LFTKLLSLIFALWIAMGGYASAQSSNKVDVLRRVNAASAALVKIASEQKSLPDVGRKAIRELVDGEDDPTVLAKLSSVSLTYLSPGRAEDHLIDAIFEEGWRNCIWRIERIGGPKAVAALESVSQDQRLDGAFSLILRETLARVKAQLPQ